MPNLISSVEDLLRLDRRMTEICTGLPMPPGSMFRMAAHHLKNYGIEVNTSNVEFIMAQSGGSYGTEWTLGHGDCNKAIEAAIIGAGVDVGNIDFNSYTTKPAVGLLVECEREGGLSGEINVLDLGAGTGDTTAALLEDLDADDATRALARRCIFHLLDASKYRLDEAVEKICNKPVNERLFGGKLQDRLRLIVSRFEEYDGKGRDGGGSDTKFDLIISNSVTHHFAFRAAFEQMMRLLKDGGESGCGGVLVIGDWHNNVFEHPAMLAELMKELGAGQSQISEFSLLFKVKTGDAHKLTARLTPEQRTANEQFTRYVVNLGHLVGGLSEGSKPFFIEAYERVGERLAKMRAAGLMVDMDELRQKHKAFARLASRGTSNVQRIMPRTDVAYVMAAAKRPARASK